MNKKLDLEKVLGIALGETIASYIGLMPKSDLMGKALDKIIRLEKENKELKELIKKLEFHIGRKEMAKKVKKILKKKKEKK